MSPRGVPPGRAALIPVRIDEGETVNVAVRLVFGPDGALLRVVVPPATSAQRDPRDAAARRLLSRLDAELARPGAPGVHALRREAELIMDLAEQLRDVEERLGPVVARAQRMAEA